MLLGLLKIIGGRGGVRRGLVRIIQILCSFILLYLGCVVLDGLDSVGYILDFNVTLSD